MKISFPPEGGNLNSIQAIGLALAKTGDTSEAISGSGSLNVIRYGSVLRANQLVGVRGAGPAYDGLYYVRTVTHNIKRGEFKQSFTVSRDGLVSATQTVPVCPEVNKYYGKFRGTVTNNIDPLGMGRLLCEVPDVLSLAPSTWAMPCAPLAGPTGTPMGAYLVPPIGAGVWIEFEKGDPDYPIWVGCRWGSMADVPPLVLLGLPISPSIVFQTAGQNSIAISDVPGPTGGIMLKSQTGAMILVNDIGITISNGQGATLVMTGPTVTVNEGALVIT